jgi:hypothetical protein
LHGTHFGLDDILTRVAGLFSLVSCDVKSACTGQKPQKCSVTVDIPTRTAKTPLTSNHRQCLLDANSKAVFVGRADAQVRVRRVEESEQLARGNSLAACVVASVDGVAGTLIHA